MTMQASEQRAVQDPAIFADGCALIDGRFEPVREARIPLLDTGFGRSDVTYDVVSVWRGRFFRLDDHLDRFERSMQRLRLQPDVDRSQIRQALVDVVRTSRLREAWVAMVCTRGMMRPGSRDPRTATNRFFTYAVPYVWMVPPDEFPKGCDLIVTRGTRRIPPDAVDPTVKNYHWGDLVRALFEAYDRGAQTAVLPDADGNITEGPGFNVFCVRDGELRTPARGVLEGITRQTALDLAVDLGITTRVGDVTTADLYSADEIFITSTGGGVMPVATLDGEPVGEEQPGPITRILVRSYWQAHATDRFSDAIEYDDADGRPAPPAPIPQAWIAEPPDTV